MSDYLQSLDLVAQRRYTDRLKILGLNKKDDPYLRDNQKKRFVDNMAKWPPVEYGHIFCYFVQRPGVYTQEELLQWKSLKGYSYFQSGFVRTVKVWNVNFKQCILHAMVNPSMKSLDKPYECWIAARSNGAIVTAHCKCMAG